MHIEQMYTNCLAEAAYYIESEGEAAIIDPIRETEPYLDKAKQRNTKIKYVFETHFHADFVSGHIDLAKKSGAQIVYGPGANTKYTVHNAKEGEEFKIGKIKIKVLHTPGHTPESSCYLLTDENEKEHCIFTGDTLFVGDVGRPDLLDGKMSKEDLAGMMYESLKKIKALPDSVIVYPAHGPGSSCGKNIGKETWSTVGAQKKANYALQDMSKEKFISIIASGLTAPPQYFFEDARINKEGYENIDSVMQQNLKPLSAEEVKEEIQNGAIVLDTRDPDDFEKGFIKGSLNIGLNGQYAVWVGTLIDISKPIILVTEEGKEAEAVLRLARVGYENVKGYLKGGLVGWAKSGNSFEKIRSLTAEEFSDKLKNEKVEVLDVRKISELEVGFVKNMLHITLSELQKNISKLDKEKTYLVHCAGGYRSMIAASYLKSQGFENICNVSGGYAKISKSDAPIIIPEPAL